MKDNILETIGNTPLIKINRLSPNPKVIIAVKLEGNNPGGSIKDRIAFNMIESAEKKGLLKKGMIILEPTSGNTGIGLAMVATVKGYSLCVTMSESMSLERRKILKSYGAKIILTPGEKGTDGAIEKALEIYKNNPEKYFMPNQFENQDNIMAHYHTTAKEIWSQTKGMITHFVAGMGTTGTLMGVQKYIKKLNPQVEIIGAEPKMKHKVQGLKNMKEAVIPKIYNSQNIDRIIRVEDDEAYYAARQLVKKEGIFAGISSGAAFHVALKVAAELEEGLVVAVLPDRGDKYVSTDLFV